MRTNSCCWVHSVFGVENSDGRYDQTYHKSDTFCCVDMANVVIDVAGRPVVAASFDSSDCCCYMNDCGNYYYYWSQDSLLH